MRLTRFLGIAVAAACAICIGACNNNSGSTGATGTSPNNTAKPREREKYVIGLVAKSQVNPVFQAARVGAEDAARDLSEKYDIDVEVRWQTPAQEDAQQQAQYVEQLVASGVDGIAISCIDANLLNTALADAVAKGVTVMTFDSDAPKSGRMAYYGVDDKAAGAAVMKALAEQIEGNGVVAVLAGNQAATNLQNRVAGVREEAAKYPHISIIDVYYHPETANDAAAKMQQVQNANPQISGWALVGGWPLYTDNALDGVYEHAKVVSLDPLPLPLEYLKKGQVQVLIGQPYYGWGYESVQYIVEKLHKAQNPPSEMIYADFDVVTSANVDEYSANWNKWTGKSGG
ncbi:MAG: sugar ABC transporter substrate-binding protein [Leptolyngbya sp. PLA3]|nr:MAG: sugar ABC transporter substrate-binding protein [Cyanobacteria bacterium CYA]MCE7968213.1 sugar ABC transporter substrate-binding protein [Leptolyngbya sp. PL-A3]